MKKIFLPLFIVLVTLSCSSDDDNTITPEVIVPDTETPEQEEEAGPGIIRITEVDATNDLVVVTNLGDSTLELGDYFLCLGPGTYATISGLTSEDTAVAPNTSITLNYDVNETEDGLAVFATSEFSSSSPEVLLDYVQWGATNQSRVSQAVAAGRWDDVNNFASGVSVYTFGGNATDVGAAFWAGEEAFTAVRVLNVDAQGDLVTLTNLGNTGIDVGPYWLCLGPGTYVNVANVATGSTMLGANETITLPYNVNPATGGLGIFSTNTFGSSDPAILVDYVQWGAANQARSNQAVTAGRWDSADNFVTQADEYDFIGGAQDVGVTFWE